MNLKIFIYLIFALYVIQPIKTQEEDAPAEEEVAEEETEEEGAGEEGEGEDGGDKEEGHDEAAATEEESEEDEELICHKPALESLGLVGLEKAEKMNLDMCSSITHSCCTVTDQMKIFENWETNKQGEELKNRLHYHTRVYRGLMAEMMKVPPIAAQIFMHLKEEEDPAETNCKIMAQRLLHFKIAEVVPKFEHALTEMHNFLYTTHKGVYCSLCDAHAHQSFNLETKEITLSQNFCRNVVSHTLYPLLYLQVHFKRIVELSATFLATCNDKGEFNPEENVPASVLPEFKEEHKEMLTQCREFRNDDNWFEYCGKICENIHIAHFSEFFQPDIKKYFKVTLFIQELLAKFPPPGENEEEGEGGEEGETAKEEEEEGEEEGEEEEEETDEEVKAEERKLRLKKKKQLLKKKNKYRRYLEDEEGDEVPDEAEDENGDEEGDEDEAEGEEGEEPSIQDLEKKYEKMEILHKSMNAVVPLDKLVILFEETGIDLFEFGHTSHITEENNLLAKALGLIKDELEIVIPVGLEDESVHVLSTSIVMIIFSLFFLFK
jgi:hypothetical protein